jgi:hypothetical protein
MSLRVLSTRKSLLVPRVMEDKSESISWSKWPAGANEGMLWLPQATLHGRVGPVSRILWEWRGYAIVRPQERFIAPLVTRPTVSTVKICVIYFTMTSARGSCANRVLLSFAKSVRSCKPS